MALTGSVLGSLGQAVGIGRSDQLDAFNQAMAQQNSVGYTPPSTQAPMYNFNFEEIENGWIVRFGAKKWMVADLEELSQRVVAIMVEHKLEK